MCHEISGSQVHANVKSEAGISHQHGLGCFSAELFFLAHNLAVSVQSSASDAYRLASSRRRGIAAMDAGMELYQTCVTTVQGACVAHSVQ
jgi:hypothetical protein